MADLLTPQEVRDWLPFGANPPTSIVTGAIRDVEGRIHLRVGNIPPEHPARGAIEGIAREMAVAQVKRFIYKNQPQQLQRIQEAYTAAETRLNEFDVETAGEDEASAPSSAGGVQNMWDTTQEDDLFPYPYPHFFTNGWGR